jgi:Fe-S cluster biogenesis protein NfuA
MRGRSDTELIMAVQALLDKEVNRSIANHGGKISIVDVRQGKLFITMSGGCQAASRPDAMRLTRMKEARGQNAINKIADNASIHWEKFQFDQFLLTVLLQIPHFCVFLVLCQQLGMRAALDDAAVFHHQNLVGFHHR